MEIILFDKNGKKIDIENITVEGDVISVTCSEYEVKPVEGMPSWVDNDFITKLQGLVTLCGGRSNNLPRTPLSPWRTK